MPRRIFNQIGFRGSLADRFAEKFIPEPNSGCWLWIGSLDRKGYGQIRAPGHYGKAKLRYATHVSLEIAGRNVPKGMEACHHCDVPACVNPDHIFIGTHRENMHDSWRKGRASKPPPSTKGRGLKIYCHRGHLLAGDNLYWFGHDYRGCRECRKINKRLWRARTRNPN